LDATENFYKYRGLLLQKTSPPTPSSKRGLFGKGLVLHPPKSRFHEGFLSLTQTQIKSESGFLPLKEGIGRDVFTAKTSPPTPSSKRGLFGKGLVLHPSKSRFQEEFLILIKNPN
jgi:hypothetical protein